MYTLNHWHEGIEAISYALNLSVGTIRNYGRELNLGLPPRVRPDVGDAVVEEVKERTQKREAKYAKKRDRLLLRRIAELEAERETILHLQGHSPNSIELTKKEVNGKGEGIANALLSDYHLEEQVNPKEVEGLNRYNLEVSEDRLDEFFRAVLRFVEIEQQSTNINKLVLWMLGDNISGWLHEELISTTLLEPTEAIVVARDRLKRGIDFLLQNSALDLTIPCVVGNHGRMTQKAGHATENGNSLEFILYHFLKSDFEHEPRVTFVIPDSGFAFVDEFGFVIRGSHGHRVRYQGGILGIGVPASKKLAQWNKLKWADLDVFGHHHTAQDGENFVANGSIIGYNSYAYKSGFSFQPPEQKFFVVHSKWKRRILSRSIFFSQ